MRVLATLATAAAIVFTPLASQAQPKPDSIRYIGGTAGGPGFTIIAGIGDIYTRAGVKTSVEVGGGNSNIVNIGNGVGDISVSFTVSIADAAEGRAPFKQKITNIRSLYKIVDYWMHLVVPADSGIRTIPDLKGKPVALLDPSAGLSSMFVSLLSTYGMKETDMRIVARGGSGRVLSAYRDRQADFYVNGGGLPDAGTIEAALVRPISILPVDDEHLRKLQAINPGFGRAVFKANSYRGQTTDVPGVGFPLIALVNDKYPEAAAYWATKAIFDNIQAVRAIHPQMADLDLKGMMNFSGVQLHPGAARFYREKGLIK